MTAEMIAYVKAELTAGKSPAEVRQALLSAGWPPGDVEQALALALGPTTIVTGNVPPPPPPVMSVGGWVIGSRGSSYRSRTTTVRQMTPGQMLLMGIVFAVVGGLLAWFGFNSYQAARSLAQNGVKTEGTVIRVEEKIDRDDNGTSRTYRPIVEYAVQDGTTKRYASNLWRNPSPFNEGQKVQMIYDPATGKAAIATDGEIYGSSFALLGAGALFFLIGLAMTVGSRRKPPIAAAPGQMPPGQLPPDQTPPFS